MWHIRTGAAGGGLVSTTRADEIYQQHVRPLSAQQRLELLSLIAGDLAAAGADDADGGEQHSLVELHGLGRTLWNGIDAQEYVNRLRDEWHDPTP